MIKRVYCIKCHKAVQRETHKGLKREYKYYCPHCQENLYKIEVYK